MLPAVQLTMVAASTELWFNPATMRKARAIELLGGSAAAAADAIGITYQAVDKWPDPLPARIADRVLAALARKHLPAHLIGEQTDAVVVAARSFADIGEGVRRRLSGKG
jgi:hypothetical protein